MSLCRRSAGAANTGSPLDSQPFVPPAGGMHRVVTKG